VTGPVGATVSFWEQDVGWPLYGFPIGSPVDAAKSWFEVGNCKNGAGTVGGDPFGRIPGRRFSVDQVTGGGLGKPLSQREGL